MEAQRVALAAGQNGTITPFEIYVEDDQAVTHRYCWLSMLDSRVSRHSTTRWHRCLLQNVISGSAARVVCKGACGGNALLHLQQV